MDRKYFSKGFEVADEKVLQEAVSKILNTPVGTIGELVELIEKYSELSMIISEELAWKYIKMTCNADNEEYSKIFNEFYSKIISKYEKASFDINKKIYDSTCFSGLSDEKYGNFKRILANDIEMFEEKNIPLQVRESELSNRYAEIYSGITVQFQGEEHTLTQMRKYLRENERELRERAWRAINESMAVESENLNNLFNELKDIRVEMAKNKGFESYRDYMHKLKGRFSYTPKDLYKFHESVEKVVVPFLRSVNETKRKKLGLESLRPWDVDASEDGRILKPFNKVEEFFRKSSEALHKIKPEFSEKLRKMEKSGYLDLENRKGKAPGGYNYPLHETGAAFIFMNAVGIHTDLVTFFHESGHALHSFATADERIMTYKEEPSEVAELASMSMEFMSMDYWDQFYTDDEDLKKAKREQYIKSLETLAWVMIIDAFQHWLYLNPEHVASERDSKFNELMDRFNTGIDWDGLEEEKGRSWLKQLHIFEVPFYYIEYAMSQLGAIALYKNYKEDKGKALENYEKFLNLGYSKPIEEIYKTAGIRFDFSESYISEIVKFVAKELGKLD